MGKPVKVLLRSIDVLHDFYVPEFRAKMDMVPGMVTYFWLTPTRAGTFEILCFELCGLGHPNMRGVVVVEEADAYQAWLQGQPTFAQLAAVRARSGPVEAHLEQGAGTFQE
jgi:cytochrome c oxidase subunit II